jgi:hypothetical protein
MHRESYWKTTLMALGGSSLTMLLIVGLSAVGSSGAAVGAGLVLLTMISVSLLLIGGGGVVCLWRDARIGSGRPDFVALSANRVPTPGLLAKFGLRSMLGSALRPGDDVRVKRVAEIRAMLDSSDTLDGLPFMPEMEPFCGRTFRVHRRVDKINDMRHKTGLRRMRDVVTLTGVRCCGSQHGGCQAECQILWKDSWLERLPAGHGLNTDPPASGLGIESADTSRLGASGDGFVCQMTSLWEASLPMSQFDLRQDVRPLLSGNVGLGVYLLVLFTRLFNAVQELRGGVDFPAMPPAVAEHSAVPPIAALATGRTVRVCSREGIAATLVNSRRKGLWFDRDMVRFCGQTGIIRKRVHRIIHEASGKMVNMKTPCAILEHVVATGEFLRLCPQHEYIFWHEGWLTDVGFGSAIVPFADR